MDSLKTLHKAEDPEAYAKLANQGLMIGYPVKIAGEDRRPDNNISYHTTLKFFDPEKDHPHKIHDLAKHLPLNPPDPKTTQIQAGQLKDRVGNDVYVLKLSGNSAEKMKEHNAKFSHMGHPQLYAYEPHISVPKEVHDKIKSSGVKTAHEAGISFGSAELMQGPKTLKKFHHKPDSSEPLIPDQSDMTAKLNVNKSEPVEQIPLEKGAMKNVRIALGMAGALVAAPHTASAPTQPANRAPASIQPPAAPIYNHNKMLRAIAAVESSSGKNVNHAAGGGPIHGDEHAVGKFGLMPQTIRETIGAHKDLKAKYGKALALKGQQFHNYMNDNKGLEDIIADRHLAHMEHVLGQNPDHLAYSWLNGVSGALHAKKSGTNIGNHWYTKRVRDAYGKEK